MPTDFEKVDCGRDGVGEQSLVGGFAGQALSPIKSRASRTRAGRPVARTGHVDRPPERNWYGKVVFSSECESEWSGAASRNTGPARSRGTLLFPTSSGEWEVLCDPKLRHAERVSYLTELITEQVDPERICGRDGLRKLKFSEALGATAARGYGPRRTFAPRGCFTLPLSRRYLPVV
jgi:hypothetical protein